MNKMPDKIQPIQWAIPETPTNPAFRKFTDKLRSGNGVNVVWGTGKTDEGRDFTVYLKGQVFSGWRGQPVTGYEIFVGTGKVGTVANVDQLYLFLLSSGWTLD
jgi:hypothetical protein